MCIAHRAALNHHFAPKRQEIGHFCVKLDLKTLKILTFIFKMRVNYSCGINYENGNRNEPRTAHLIQKCSNFGICQTSRINLKYISQQFYWFKPRGVIQKRFFIALMPILSDCLLRKGKKLYIS